MTRLRVVHATRYEYDSPASFSQHLMRLEPPENADQFVVDTGIVIDPAPQDSETFTDAFGNRVCTATVTEPHETLEIVATSLIERRPDADLMSGASTAWEEVAAAARMPSGLAASLFAFPTRFTRADDAIEAYARKSFPAGRPVLDGARELCKRIYEDFTYDGSATEADTPATESFAEREGVCQDFSHVMLAACRSLGLPAAYVSGYLRTLPPPGKPRLVGADATHAWVSVWDPAIGWSGFDPTNDMEPGVDHVLLATGRDYADCAPVIGLVLGSGDQTLSVSVDVASEDDD